MKITYDMREAFGLLGEPAPNAPGPFTPQLLIDMIGDGLKATYNANPDPEFDADAFVAFAGIGGATMWPVQSFMDSEAGKNELIGRIRAITKEFQGVTMVALCSAAWQAKHNDEGKTATESPDRVEIVMIALELRDGEGSWTSFDVLRLDTGNHLVLRQSDDNPTHSGGRFSNFFNHPREGN